MSPAVQKLYAFAIARYFDALRLRTGRPLVLFFRDGGIGDILCTLPAAAALADRHPEAYKIYCTHPSFTGLPTMLGRFDRVLGIKSNDLVAAAARRHTVYRFRYPDEQPGESSKDYLADEFSTAFGLPAGLPWPKLDTGAPSQKVAALFSTAGGQPTVCIHTGPTWAVREWPQESWADLVARLQARFGCRVLHIGASRHFREGERKEPAIRGATDCRDVYSLMETMQIVARSRLLVGIDSGMIHAGVAFGLPVVGVFGPTSAVLRLPQRENTVGLAADVPCLGCHHRHPRLHWQSGCPYDIRCMRGLSVDCVFEKSAQILAG